MAWRRPRLQPALPLGHSGQLGWAFVTPPGANVRGPLSQNPRPPLAPSASRPLSPHHGYRPKARGGLRPSGSVDLPYLFLSFLFLEPEYPPQVTEICSTKGFYRKLQMTRGRAKSRFIFKPRALSDTLSTHPSAPSLGQKHLPMLNGAWTHAGTGRRGGQAWTSFQLSPRSGWVAGGGSEAETASPRELAQCDQHHSFIFFIPQTF